MINGVSNPNPVSLPRSPYLKCLPERKAAPPFPHTQDDVRGRDGEAGPDFGFGRDVDTDYPSEPQYPNDLRFLTAGITSSDIVKLITGESDSDDLTPPTGPVADACADLSKTGYVVSDTQVRHSIANFDNHSEALVVCDDKTEHVYTFKNVDDIKTFTLAKSNPVALPQETRTLLTDLQTIETSGASLSFSRKGRLLKTDAAGAALILGRGEPLVVFDRYGSPTTVTNAEEAATQAKSPPVLVAAKEDVLKSMLPLEKKGFAIQPDFELPEDIQVTDPKKMIKHALSVRKDPNRLPLNERKYTIDQLAGSGLATVIPPKKPGSVDEGITLPGFGDDEDEPDAEPLELPEPRVVNRVQLAELAQIQAGTFTPAQKTFFDDLKKIREDSAKKPMVFSRETNSLQKGGLHKANDLVCRLNILDGGPIVLLNSDGTLVHLDNANEVHDYASSGTITHLHAAPSDPTADKTNLLMLYYDAPFDPKKPGGIYEDTPLRAAQVGSNANVDIVTLRSDLPHKNNLRDEYLQPEDMQLVKKLDPKTMMNDPTTLENFVYETLKQHPHDKHIRLMVAGHGGAELGLLPDGDENDATAHGAMNVDDFAGAIHNGLARFNKETGQSKKIDNLIVGSCLMANTSFINALAKKGDVAVLSASPETLMGNDPNITFSYLGDPKTADKSAQDFASDMVDLLYGHTAFPNGKKNMQFADTYGAYDLSPAKAQKMKDSLDELFKAVLAEPQYAKYVKEDIAHCPTYGINRIVNLMFGVNQRDTIQVAERIAGDARIKSEAIKQACQSVVDATSAVVLKQKMSERYADRRGPTLYLPTEPFAIDERLLNTDLIKTTSFVDFINLVASQPGRRTLLESLTYEVDKVMREARKAEKERKKAAAAGGTSPAESASTEAKRIVMKVLGEPDDGSQADKAAESLHSLEKADHPWYAQLYHYGIGVPVVAAVTAVGAAAGAVVGAGLMGTLGTLLGLHAGLTGRSVAQNFLADKPLTASGGPVGGSGARSTSPAGGAGSPVGGAGSGTPFVTSGSSGTVSPASGTGKGSPSSVTGKGSPASGSPPPVAADLEEVFSQERRPIARIGLQALFAPLECGGQQINRNVSYNHGTALGRLAGTAIGVPGGALGGLVAGAALGGAAGGFIAYAISSTIMRTRR